MELLQEPSVKSKYDKCKLKVKFWEHEFKKKNGRLPSKLDIKEADNEIRYAYKMYFNLKSEALEKSFQDVEGFNSDEESEIVKPILNASQPSNSFNESVNCNKSSESPSENPILEKIDFNKVNTEKTWGEHLSNAKVEIKKDKEITKPSVNTSFSQKLFKNSSFSKRNPRKSLSFVHHKSDNSINETITQSHSLSQPVVTKVEKTIDEDDSVDFLMKVRVVKPFQPTLSKSLNVAKSVLDDEFKTNRNLDSGWISRVAQTAGMKLENKSMKSTNFTFSSSCNDNFIVGSDEEIIGDSDEEDNSQMHFTKKRKIDLNFSQKIPITSNFNKKVVQSKIDKKGDEKDDEKINESLEITEKVHEKPEQVIKDATNKQETQRVQRNLTRKCKTINKSKIIDENKGDNSDEDPDFHPETENTIYDFTDETTENLKTKSQKDKKSLKPSKKPKQPKKQNDREKSEDDEEENTYELEYSIKPRRITVPRDINIKNTLKKHKSIRKPSQETLEDQSKTRNGPKSQDAQQREKFEKKIASGSLNDNFVRINIQKKVFVRGKKTMTYSKYKKKQWKQHKKANSLCGPNMDMGGCDGGQLICFTCGDVGHFAQKCPKNKEEQLLPLSVASGEEFCPFPTLQEACELSKGQLAVRKPKNRIVESPEDLETIPRNPEGLETNSEGLETNPEGLETNPEGLETNPKGLETNPEGLETNPEGNPDENLDTDNDTDSLSDDEKYQNKFDAFDDDLDEDLLQETIKLEKAIKQIENQMFTDETKTIKPYYPLKEDGTLIDTPQEIYDVLKMFGHDSFRPGQEKTIMRILSGKSTLVTLSTGSGKSLCYQLPAYLLAQREPCIALIVSPLVSLMEDQVMNLPPFLKAECLHTNKTKVQKERILSVIAEKNLHILLVSPEAIVAGEKQKGFGSLLRKLPPIAFACIDEAHCVSQWSHNFRPSYLMICRILKERLGVRTILGLTATATRSTCESIVKHLDIKDGSDGIISDTPLPDNLRLTVSKDENRDYALLKLLLSERFEDLKSVIVYCTRRQECERLAGFLRTSLKSEKPTEIKSKKRKKTNVQAEPYHAGLSASRRRTIQNSFMRGDLRIVVATVAFGMGINKSDIRAVIHYNLPKNFESYVQEVGRAGRDGLPAHCHLFLDARGGDENELQRHIYSDSIDRHVIRKLLQKIFVPCSCKGQCPKHEVAFSVEQTVRLLDIPEENIATLLCYLELHEERYIEVLSSAYITCKVSVYGPLNYLRKAAQDCPPLAMALAMFGNEEETKKNTFEFPVVEVAAAMGWDSGICKYKLKNLEWINENGRPRRSCLSVTFLDIGFRLLAPGNLTDDQLDEALVNLYGRVQNQEQCSLKQLHLLHETVTKVAEKSYNTCISDRITEKETLLKSSVREYFNSANPLDVENISNENGKKCDEEVISNDCRTLINMYRDNNFTGRAIARIFYGIPSPNYPAVVWGRCKFWRVHLDTDFNEILKIATREILKTR